MYLIGISVFFGGVLFCGTIVSVFFYGMSEFIKAGIELETVLDKENANDTWNKWVNMSHLNMSISFYIFNITDIDDLSSYEQVGPYVYNITRFKNVTEENEDFVTYRETTTYHFNANRSNGTEEDIIYFIDVPAMTLIKFAGYERLPRLNFAPWPKAASEIFLQLLNTTGFSFCPNYVCPTSVKSILFDGMETASSGLISNLFIGFFRILVAGLAEILTLHPDDKPSEFGINGTFSFYNNKNNTEGDLLRVDRGILDSSKFGATLQYNGKTELSWFSASEKMDDNGTYCNRIIGTDGTLFQPFLKENPKDGIWVFIPDLCRSFYLEPGDALYEFRKKIPSIRYILSNKTMSPEDKVQQICYCTRDKGVLDKLGLVKDGSRDDLCNFTGIMPMSKCKNNAPIYISKPHFLGDEQRVFSAGNPNIMPDPEKHDTYYEVEPNTGTVLEIHKRIQINIAYPDNSSSTDNRKLHPMLWFDENIYLMSTDELENRYIFVLQIIEVFKWLGLGFAIIIICSGILISFISRDDAEDKEDTPQKLINLNHPPSDLLY